MDNSREANLTTTELGGKTSDDNNFTLPDVGPMDEDAKKSHIPQIIHQTSDSLQVPGQVKICVVDLLNLVDKIMIIDINCTCYGPIQMRNGPGWLEPLILISIWFGFSKLTVQFWFYVM